MGRKYQVLTAPNLVVKRHNKNQWLQAEARKIKIEMDTFNSEYD